MFNWLKFTHIAGLVIFLGSIFTFILISTLIENASLENISFGRQIISRGTKVLTIPGMLTIAISGLWLGYIRYGLRHRFFLIKALLISVILINTTLFILPAVNSATDIAIKSLEEGVILSEYKPAYMKESMFGALNVFIAIVAAIIGVRSKKID